MLGKLFSTAGTRFLGSAVLVLLIACIGLGLWGRHEHGRAAAWQAHAEVEASNHRQTKANYHTAQAVAAELARAARLETERRSAELARKADDANEDADRWRAAARRFADAGGLQDCVGAGAASPASAARTGAPLDPPARGDGPGAASVVLSRTDFDTLTDNTARLLRVHAWGDDLIAASLAKPGDN